METNRSHISRSNSYVDSSFPHVHRSMTCHPLVSRAVWLNSVAQDVVSCPGTKDNCKNQVCIIRHEHKHQKERQANAGSIQHGAHGTIERGNSESLLPRDPRPIQQARLLGVITMTFRRAPSTRSRRRPTRVPDPQFHTNALVKVPREDAEVLVEHAQCYDGEEGEEELEVRADVPLGKYDACVDYLGIPEHPHLAPCRLSSHVVCTVIHYDCGVR